MKRVVALALTTFLLSACSGDVSVDPASPGGSEDWTATPKSETLPDFEHTDYDLEYEYYSMAVQYRAKVEVRDDKVAKVEFIEPLGAPVRELTVWQEEWAKKATMDFILENVREAKASGEVEVKWNDTENHLSKAELDPIPGAIDDESSWDILGLQLIPTSTGAE